MRPLDKFDNYLRKGIVRRRIVDKSRARDLAEEACRKSKSMELVLRKIGLSDENANDIVEYCYDILINLVRSKMLLAGFSCAGLGAHEAEISYLRKLGFSDNEVRVANQLRYFRNGIMYYGKRFDCEYARKIVGFLEKARKILGEGG